MPGTRFFRPGVPRQVAGSSVPPRALHPRRPPSSRRGIPVNQRVASAARFSFLGAVMTHTSHTVQDPNVDTIRQQLEQQLEERLDTTRRTRPSRTAERRPGRLPDRGVEPYGRRTDHRSLESAGCRHLRPLHPLRRPDRSRATRGPAARCRLHRMSKPCRRRITPGIPRRIAASRTGPGPATMTAAAQTSEITNTPFRRSRSTVGWTTEVPTHRRNVGFSIHRNINSGWAVVNGRCGTRSGFASAT